jgi:hypothetical protein
VTSKSFAKKKQSNFTLKGIPTMNPVTDKQNAAPVAPETASTQVNESSIAYNNSNAGVHLFHEPGEVVELRALASGPPVCSLHTNLDEMQLRAKQLNDAGYNCYHTINPITSALESGSAGDAQITAIRWIPGDVDPVRRDADGKTLVGIASTEQEKATSLQVAERLIEWYRMQFGIEPALVDHGNGYCVMAPIELVREDAPLVEEFIKAQARMFDTVDAHIDPVCANPSRILRIPGTVNRKGQETPVRPHRRARIVRPGNRDSFLTKEDLLRILPPPEQKKNSLIVSAVQGVLPEWVEDFLKHSGITFRKRHDYKGGSRWILDLGDKLEFDYCPNQSEHGDPNAPTTQAVFLTSQGIPGFQCAHGHCVDIRWRQFRDYHEQRNVDEGRGRFREEWPEVGDDALIISPEALNDTITKAEALLAKKIELRYFRRGTDLVKPVQHNKKDISGLVRDKESVVVQPVSQHTIVRDVSLHATCVNAKRKPTSFTANFAEHLLDRVRCEETEYRVLDMVTSSPVLLSDGTVLDRAGHKCNVLFVAGSADYPTVPEQPTKADAQRALASFDSIYQNFPFVRVGNEPWQKTAGFAGVLAGVLTLVARPAIPTAPIITASATTRGSGKTKSVEAGVVAAIGHKPTVVSFHNEDEFAKTLVPLLREGDRATLIDNVSIPLSGDMLCSVLTSEEHRARILGQSEQVRLINRSVFFATGNNLAIQGDLTRRAIQIQLDPDCEHPERRRFDFDPVVRAGKLHPILCTSALTALRAYWVAGRPDVLDRPALGSFEEWDRLICGCLAWLGYADPVSTQGAVEDSDPEREANLELLSTWWETLGEPSSLGKIGATTMSPVRELLGSGEAWNARAAGKRLRSLDKKVVGGFKLQSRLLKGARLWYVTKNGKTNPEAVKPVPEVQNPGW